MCKSLGFTFIFVKHGLLLFSKYKINVRVLAKQHSVLTLMQEVPGSNPDRR
jgi:hypothetical protein